MASEITILGKTVTVPAPGVLFQVPGPWKNGRKAFMCNVNESLEKLQDRIAADIAKQVSAAVAQVRGAPITHSAACAQAEPKAARSCSVQSGLWGEVNA